MGVRKPNAKSETVPAKTEGTVHLAHQNPSLTHLDRLVHERVRLAVLSALAVNKRLSFTDLRELLGTTDGNLSVHCRRLEEAGYIEIRKSFEGRIPRTDYRLTDTGRQALQQYLDHMEALIERVRE